MAEPKNSFMDVSEPGKTPAGATSRPIIVSKGAAIKDPMMAESPKTAVEPALPPSATKKSLQPLSAEPETTQATAADAAPSKSTPADTATEPTVEAPLDDIESTDESKHAAADKADVERNQAVEKLITSKQYFVPIGAVAQRRNSRNTALLAVVLLLIVGAVLAIDAELIETGISLPFDLIK